MALEVTVYTVEAANRQDTPYPECDFHTQDFFEADAYAQASHLMVIANTYEWADSEPVAGSDYTPQGEDKNDGD